ncbi:MAG: fibronectin type III domain-containing protein [Eubacterium sp.]|nr:fibronectin type III domain-containing protein [Eubacterium sp.]
MKISFKKLFACLMALIMVMTITPFTAVTASAAEAKSSNIAETEAKYKTAPSTTFTAKKGMSEVGWLNCTEVKTTDGQTYRQSFAPSSNVLYWPSNYVGTTDCIKAKANRLDFRMFYPSAVLMWDGSTDTYMPIVCIAQNTGILDGSRTIYYAAPYDVARPDNATSPEHSANFFADRWRSVSGGGQIQDFNKNKFGEGSANYFEANVLSKFVSDGENPNKYYNFGDTKGSVNFASFLHIDSGITFDSDGYMSEKLYWTTNSLNSKTFNPSQDNNSWQSSSTIYVVNYKPIVDAANEAADNLKNLIQTDYTPESINAYYDAIQALYDFDPNTYFDQNDGKTATDVEDIALRVGKCTTEIKKLVDNYEAAKLNVENSRQYRITFTDAQGALVADHYYKANETIIQPSLDDDKFVNTDPEGHYTVSYEWQPAISATATADADYVEKAVIPAKTAHTYTSYTPVYQGGQYAHTRKCTVAECGYVDWAYCNFVRDDEKSKDATCTTDEVLVKKCSVCGQSYTDTTNNTKALGHDMQLEKTVAPTCTEEGYDLYKCSRCDVTEKRNIKPATSGSHDYQFTKTVAPTCNEEGYDLYTCSKCGATEKRNIKPADASKHVFTKTKTVVATCTEKGYDLYTCSKCGATEKRNETAVNPDNHNFTKTSTVAATCTEKGYDVYTCSRCHKTEHRNETAVNPNNHNFVKTSTVAPTCTDKGYDIYTCSLCGKTEHRNEVPAIAGNHSYQFTKTVVPTCTEEGYDLYTCSKCGATEKRNVKPVDPNNHNYTSTVVAPTCTDKGYTKHTCTRCGNTYNDNEIKALGHSFTKYVPDGNATCTEDGTMTAKCDRCNVKNTITSPNSKLGHSYSANIIPATTTAQGYTVYTCTRCGDSYVSDYTPVLQPTLTPDESKISNDYGVDAKTAQDINYILIINNVSKDTASLTESRMTANPPKGDGDYKGSSFGLLRAQTTKLTKNSVTVKWNKVKNADGYIVYGAKCGAKSKYKVLKVVSGKTTSYTHKKLKKGTYYKYNVVAFKYVNGVKVTIAASKKVHATTQGGKYGVAKSVKLNKSKATIKKGKTFKIKASEVKKDKTIRKHRGICYESSNTKIATVDSKGKIKAKKKGKCTVYVYAQNGVYKTVKVTVK